MKRHLDVAVGIADAVIVARSRRVPLDVAAQARSLTEGVDLSIVTPELVADILAAEGRAAGVCVTRSA